VVLSPDLGEPQKKNGKDKKEIEEVGPNPEKIDPGHGSE
jgi:hypothetical protein